MVYAKIVDKEDCFVAQNKNFNITINLKGCVDKWVLNETNSNLLKESGFCDLIKNGDVELSFKDEDYYSSSRSTSVSFQIEQDFFTLRKVYSVTNNAFISDIYIQPKTDINYSYFTFANFSNVDFFMIEDKKYVDDVSIKTDNMLIVNGDYYLGCIFKECDVYAKYNPEHFLVKYEFNLNLKKNELFRIYFKFALV